MKWIVRSVLVVVVLALLAGIANVLRPRPLEVDAVVAAMAPLEQAVVDDGVARVREHYTVSAPVAGTLARVELHEGDVVDAGAVVARLLPLPSPLLDPRSREVAEQRLASAVDAQRQAAATEDRATAAADQARRELERTCALAG
jgi:HlyD family secretion protein